MLMSPLTNGSSNIYIYQIYEDSFLKPTGREVTGSDVGVGVCSRSALCWYQ